MNKNEGTIDRALRVIVGIALLVFAFTSASSYAWIGYIGIVPLLTGAVGMCPLYSMLGVSTCAVKQG
jgi:hypothetical protein